MRLIDADALKALIIRRRKEVKTLTGIDMVMAVDDAPTVDAAPVKHGRWAKNKYGYITCSICDSFPLAVMTGSLITMNLHYELYESEYCPYCGAKMDLEG